MKTGNRQTERQMPGTTPSLVEVNKLNMTMTDTYLSVYANFLATRNISSSSGQADAPLIAESHQSLVPELKLLIFFQQSQTPHQNSGEAINLSASTRYQSDTQAEIC